MNVSLTSELEQFVSAKVESGLYTSASEVVREALRLLEEHDRARSFQLNELNEELRRRLKELDQDKHVSGPRARAKLAKKSATRRRVTA